MKNRINLWLLLIFISVPLQAEMLLNKGILNFYAGESIREDIEITNQGDDTLYLSVTVFEISNSETGNPQRLELKDPRTAGILASPNKIVISAGQKKILRVMARQVPAEKDKVYRIKVMPNVPPIEIDDDGSKKKTGVKVMLGYELLAFIRPLNHQAILDINRQGQQLNFINNGNTNVVIRTIKQCQSEDDCKEIKGKRLYAGQSWGVKLPYAEGKILIYKSVGNDFSSVEY